MLSNEVIEAVSSVLTKRIDELNAYILQKMGEDVRKFRTLTPTEAKKLADILKYGGDFDKIVKKLAEVTGLNIVDIYDIFDEVAKRDLAFAEKFYKYRNMKFIPYEQNEVLQRQVRAIARITAEEYFKNTGISSLGFGFQNDKGEVVFKGLKETYEELIDKAVLSVSQGRETFDQNMYGILKDIGESGIKVIYPTTYVDKNGIVKHYNRRLDSVIQMDMQSGIRKLHNELERTFGEEFGSDGVEISVHSNPAPDHAEVQGHIFSNDEFEKFQNDMNARDVNGVLFTADYNGRDRRAISQYNCYHVANSIVLGVSKPTYSQEELQKIINDNNKGFEFEGKHYTNYEGTQLQRRLETEIRKAKDSQIIGRASDNSDLINKSQQRITYLTNKYRDLSKISKLPTQLERARVVNYKRVAKR